MSSPLRVLYLAHSVDAHGGGMERVGHALITGSSSDVTFTVVASEGLDQLPSSVRTVHLALPARPAFVRIAWFYVRSARLVRQLRREVDLVHACGAITTAKVDVASVHLCHAAVDSSARAQLRGWRGANAAVARALGLWSERRQYQPSRVRRLVAVSDAVERDLARYYANVSRTTVANGVDVQRFLTSARPDHAPDAALRLVMVTGDFALKGVDVALEAVAMTPNVRLVVVGDGALESYREKCRQRGISDRVTFVGHRDDVREYYASSDVVLCVSHYESFGLYLVEAALGGCAVVATNVGVASTLIGAGDGGVLVAPSVNELATVLNELATDRARVVAMGQRARERAKNFSKDAMLAGYLDVYRSLVGSP